MLDATLTRNADLALSDEQQDFVRAIRDFCEREFAGDRLRAATEDFTDPLLYPAVGEPQCRTSDQERSSSC